MISDYDKESSIESPLLKEPEVPEIPYLNETIESVAHGIEVFDARSRWAETLLDKAEGYKSEIGSLESQIDVIVSGVKVAMVNLQHPLGSLEKNINTKVEFLTELDENAQKAVDWEQDFKKLDRIQLIDYFQTSDAKAPKTLAGWIDKEEVAAASVKCSELRSTCYENLRSLQGGVTTVLSHANELDNSVKRWSRNKIHSQSYMDIFQDIKALALRIKKDAEHVSSLSETAPNLKNVVKLAALHEKEFLNEIKSYIFDLYQKVVGCVEFKRTYQDSFIDYLRQISQLQYQTSLLRPKLQTVQRDLHRAEEHRVSVAQVVELPYLYGMFLLEHHRRKLWTDHIKSMVNETTDGISTLNQEEIKCRESWKKHCGNAMLKLLKSESKNEEHVPTIEVVLKDEHESECEVSKQDIDKFFRDLDQIGFNELLNELKLEYDGLVKRVNASKLASLPAAQQQADLSASQKMFKSGSISENSLMLLNGDNNPSKRNATEVKEYENKIKEYEMRIRKLEGLLHRKQYAEMTSGAGTPITPPGTGTVTGNSGMLNKSERPQPNRLLEQVHNLTEERKVDRERIESLKRHNHELEGKLQQVQQEKDNAENIKSDLLANMSAQESEFSRERRGLHQEISELKMRVDELEEEAEREGDRANELEMKRDHEVQKLEKQLEVIKLREHENNKNYSEELDKFIAKEHALKDENEKLRNKVERFIVRSKDLSQRLYTSYRRSCEMLECIGLQVSKEIAEESNQVVSFTVNRVRGLRRSSKGGGEISCSNVDNNTSSMLDSEVRGSGIEITTTADGETGGLGPTVLYWMNENPEDEGEDMEQVITREEERYTKFTNEVYIDYDIFRDSVYDRFKAVERLARKGQQYRDRAHRAEKESRQKISIKSFKSGDLALFLPTRDQTRDPQPWATFNVGAPHYFLKPNKEHHLDTREWLVARINDIEDRTVNRAVDTPQDNPFDLSDGLKWHWVEATEER